MAAGGDAGGLNESTPVDEQIHATVVSRMRVHLAGWRHCRLWLAYLLAMVTVQRGRLRVLCGHGVTDSADNSGSAIKMISVCPVRWKR